MKLKLNKRRQEEIANVERLKTRFSELQEKKKRQKKHLFKAQQVTRRQSQQNRKEFQV